MGNCQPQVQLSTIQPKEGKKKNTPLKAETSEVTLQVVKKPPSASQYPSMHPAGDGHNCSLVKHSLRSQFPSSTQGSALHTASYCRERLAMATSFQLQVRLLYQRKVPPPPPDNHSKSLTGSSVNINSY